MSPRATDEQLRALTPAVVREVLNAALELNEELELSYAAGVLERLLREAGA